MYRTKKIDKRETSPYFITAVKERNNQFQYLVSDFNEQDEDDDDKQVVNHSDNSDDDVDDLECKVTVSLSARSRMWARYRVWLSSSGVSVVTLLHSSFDSNVFSIAAWMPQS